MNERTDYQAKLPRPKKPYVVFRKRRLLKVFTWIISLLFISHFINIANYSFLNYNFVGEPSSNPLFSAIKFSRLPLLLLGFIIVLVNLSNNKRLAKYFIVHIDVIIFSIVIYFGLINSIDLLNGFLYSIWHMASFFCLLAFFYYLKEYFNFHKRLSVFFRLLFWSNFVVIPLLIANWQSLFSSKWYYDMSFSSQTFYPYCLLTMMIALYGSQIFAKQSIFKGRQIELKELITVILLIFFCFVSARRTPLFLMAILSFMYLFHRFGSTISKRIALIVTLTALMAILAPKAFNYIEEHKYELAVLKKLNDLQKSEGELSNDSSYEQREDIWALYEQVIARNPMFGTGSYNSTTVQTSMFKTNKLAGFSTHNTYYGVLVEHGYIGLFCFAIILLRSCWMWISKNSVQKSFNFIIFILLPVLAINWNEYNLIPGQVFYWTTILVVLMPRML